MPSLTNSYHQKDPDLVNLRNLETILTYFNDNNICEIIRLISETSPKNFEKRAKNLLIIFLIKSKFVIKMIENSQNFYQNDIFLLENEGEFKKFQKSVDFVTLDTEKKCQKNYDKMGHKMQRFFYALTKANKQKPNYAHCFRMIKTKQYFDMAIDVGKLNQLKLKLERKKLHKIFTPKAIFNYMGNVFDKQVEEMVEMQLSFPDPEFLYLYYQLIDSEWTLLGLKIYSEHVKFETKLYMPLELFEEEFEVNRKYPQTQVRSLSNRQFLGDISPEFLIQNQFLSRRQMVKSSKAKYLRFFRKSLREYSVFDLESIKSGAIAN